MSDAPLPPQEIAEALAVCEFTPEDRNIVDYALKHNLGCRLAEAVQHLLDDYSRALRALQQRAAAREADKLVNWSSPDGMVWKREAERG